MNNPFNPSFGRVPPVFIDREVLIDEVIEGLKNPDSPYRTTVITGQRGVGKTAFLTDICKHFSGDRKWIVCQVPSDEDLLSTITQSVYRKATKDIRKALDSIDSFTVSAFGFQLSYDKKDETINYQLLLEEMLEILREKGISLLVAIDEVDNNETMRRFASIYQILIREDLPIALLMTGLPQQVSELQNNKVLTFLLRSASVSLSGLDMFSVKHSYEKTFAETGRTLDENTSMLMAKMTRGYAFAFQLLGYLVWNADSDTVTQETVNSVTGEYETQLFSKAYGKIYESLSPMDREIAHAMAEVETETGEIPMSYLREHTGKAASYLSNYRTRLMDAKIIDIASYGYVRWTLPYFGKFLKLKRAFDM